MAGRGLRRLAAAAIMKASRTMRSVPKANSHLPVCWLHALVCPRRYLALLPAQARPNLFSGD